MTKIQANRAIVRVGQHELMAFRLSDGTYGLRTEQVAEAVGTTEKDLRVWLKARFKEGEPGWIVRDLEIEGEPIQTRALLSFDLALRFWHDCASNGNSETLNFLMALATEGLYKLAKSEVKSAKRAERDILNVEVQTSSQVRYRQGENDSERQEDEQPFDAVVDRILEEDAELLRRLA